MSKVFNTIIENCINKMYQDAEIKEKLEKDVINPIIYKAYCKCKPYIYMILYMYGIIVLLLVIIILLILFKKK
jgi:hypothetical protein